MENTDGGASHVQHTGIDTEHTADPDNKQICHERDRGIIARKHCQNYPDIRIVLTMDEKTNLFINPSWDWDQIDDLNYRLQAISAIESGVVLFKPTVDGMSIVTDPYGNLSYKESTLGGDYEEVRYVDVPGGRTDTIFSRIGTFVSPLWSMIAFIIIAYVLYGLLKGFIRSGRFGKSKE